eukprot:6404403-Amphidinium_carterae.1
MLATLVANFCGFLFEQKGKCYKLAFLVCNLLSAIMCQLEMLQSRRRRQDKQKINKLQPKSPYIPMASLPSEP